MERVFSRYRSPKVGVGMTPRIQMPSIVQAVVALVVALLAVEHRALFLGEMEKNA